MRAIGIMLSALALSGCVTVMPPPISPAASPAVRQLAQPAFAPSATLSPDQAALNFITVIDRVEPMAEALCRARTRGVNCDLQIVIDPRRRLPANAFQTVDPQGRPVVGFTLALIADARSADELAFVLGHEAAHHIAGHIPRKQEEALQGALMAGVLAAMTGADARTAERVQELGASVAAQRYSKEFELEADALGAEIALRAGYDPVLGAGFFNRLPDPGDRFLGSHPPSSQRQALVAAVVARLAGGS